VRLPIHVWVHIYDHIQGALEQYFVQLLSWIPSMYVPCVFVQYAAVCTNTQRTYIDGIQLTNGTKYCSRALWRCS